MTSSMSASTVTVTMSPVLSLVTAIVALVWRVSVSKLMIGPAVSKLETVSPALTDWVATHDNSRQRYDTYDSRGIRR